MGLDINTKKGQESLNNEIRMLKYISKCWGVKIKITKKNLPIVYDGVLLKDLWCNGSTAPLHGVSIDSNSIKSTIIKKISLWRKWLDAPILEIGFYGFDFHQGYKMGQ